MAVAKKEVCAANPSVLKTRRFLRGLASGESIRAAALRAELNSDEMRDIVYPTEEELKRWTERAAAGKSSWHYDINKEANNILKGTMLVSAFIDRMLSAAEEITDDKAKAKLYSDAAKMQLMRATADGDKKASPLERAAQALRKGRENKERELKKEGLDKTKRISDNKDNTGIGYTKGGTNEHQDGDTRH